MKSIPLSQGQFALVDDWHFDRLSQWKWYYSEGYAIRSVGTGPLKHTIMMHRVVMNAPDGVEVDHRDMDGLNNCENNLRFCTRQQNKANQRKQRTPASSQYKGVSRSSPTQTWRACIKVNYKKIHLGCYADEADAARAYDAAARKYFGEFARLNFPQEGQ